MVSGVNHIILDNLDLSMVNINQYRRLSEDTHKHLLEYRRNSKVAYLTVYATFNETEQAVRVTLFMNRIDTNSETIFTAVSYFSNPVIINISVSDSESFLLIQNLNNQ